MTKKDIVTKLTMLKLMYGYNKIPVTMDVDLTDFETIQAVAKLAKEGYLIYSADYVRDDEGIDIRVNRGYVFSSKAIDLLKEKAK